MAVSFAQVYCSTGSGGLSNTKFVDETLSTVGAMHLTQAEFPGRPSHCVISAALKHVLLTVLRVRFGTL